MNVWRIGLSENTKEEKTQPDHECCIRICSYSDVMKLGAFSLNSMNDPIQIQFLI